ncbi:MAG: WG repeat-containing protein [Bacteroidota bacterium]|nr:WG repeat-containing protein [Bacteroidota bacterium]
MKKLSLLGFLLISSIVSVSQNLVPFKNGNELYGYKDKSGNIVIQPEYKEANKFYKNVAWVTTKDDKDVLINESNKALTPLYDRAYGEGFDSTNDLAAVSLNDKYGFVDLKGKVVIPLIYQKVTDFEKGLANAIINHKAGLINTSGKVVIPIKYDDQFLIEFDSKGYAPAALNNKWGYLDVTGKTIIPFIYDDAYPFVGDYAMVGKGKGKYGMIDCKNKISVPLIYSDFGVAGEDLYIASLDKVKYGFIDHSGKVIIPFVYNSVGRFENGKSLVKKGNEEFYIDKTGSRVDK